MAPEISAVLEYGAPAPGETAVMMEDKLRFHTDSWDLSVDLRAGLCDIIVIDARSRDAYAAGHIPGAVSFPSHTDGQTARADFRAGSSGQGHHRDQQSERPESREYDTRNSRSGARQGGAASRPNASAEDEIDTAFATLVQLQAGALIVRHAVIGRRR
jgi:rhodanese-related sulfurtransferase